VTAKTFDMDFKVSSAGKREFGAVTSTANCSRAGSGIITGVNRPSRKFAPFVRLSPRNLR
jgi:hypothetical protein